MTAALRDKNREVTVPAQRPGLFDFDYARTADDMPTPANDDEAEARRIWDERTLEILKLKDKVWIRDASPDSPMIIKNYLNRGNKTEVEKLSEIAKAKAFLENLERMVVAGRSPLAEAGKKQDAAE